MSMSQLRNERLDLLVQIHTAGSISYDHDAWEYSIPMSDAEFNSLLPFLAPCGGDNPTFRLADKTADYLRTVGRIK